MEVISGEVQSVDVKAGVTEIHLCAECGGHIRQFRLPEPKMPTRQLNKLVRQDVGALAEGDRLIVVTPIRRRDWSGLEVTWYELAISAIDSHLTLERGTRAVRAAIART